MSMKKQADEIYEDVYSILPILKVIFFPKKMLQYCSKAKLKTKITVSIILVLLMSLFYTILFSFRDELRLDNLPKLSLLILLQIILMIPCAVSSIVFIKSIKNKLETVLFFAVISGSVLLLPVWTITLLFYITENYVFYFLIYILIIATLIYILLVIPITINAKINKVWSTLLVIVSYSISSTAINFVTTGSQPKFHEMYKIDRIFSEYQEYDLLEATKLEYIINNSKIISTYLYSAVNNREAILDDVVDISFNNIIQMEDYYRGLLERLEFRKNRNLIELILQNIEIHKRYYSNYLKYKNNMLDRIDIEELKTAISESNIKKIITDVNNLNSILELLNANIKEMSNCIQETNKNVEEINIEIKDQTEWIQMRLKFPFLI